MKTFTPIVSLVLTIFLFIGTFSITAQAAGGNQKIGIAFITASSLRLRGGPGTQYTTLDYGYNREVVVLEEKLGDWYKVIYNLQPGYMHKDYLRTTTRENAELGYGRVNGSRVNLRSGPGTGYSVVGQATLNDRAYIIGINAQWYKIIYKDLICYIRSDYLDLTEIPYENQASTKEPVFFRGGTSTGTPVSPGALNQSAAPVRGQQIVNTAKQYIGVPYVWGGSTPAGFDCSGFVQYVFQLHGISLPRTSRQQWTAGKSIATSQLQPGDLVFFNTSGSGVSHLGIWVGDGQFIHASSSRGVMISALSNSYWSPRYMGARRVL